MRPSLRSLASLILAWPFAAQPVHAGSGEKLPALSFLHAAGTAIADEKEQPVILRGCNLGNWFLIEPWMLGIFDRAGLHDQSQLERTLTDRFGSGKKTASSICTGRTGSTGAISRFSKRGASTSSGCRSTVACWKTTRIPAN